MNERNGSCKRCGIAMHFPASNGLCGNCVFHTRPPHDWPILPQSPVEERPVPMTGWIVIPNSGERRAER